MLSTVLISVSDDDSDDLSGKKRARVRLKRKKHGHRGSVRGEVLRRSLRFLRMWWPVLVFLPAIGLLLFESSKLATDRERVGNSDPEPAKEPPPANLNRLDPVTRVIGGVRQPCFKTLLPEEIQNLEFPERADTNFPIRRVVYKSDSGSYQLGGNDTVMSQHTEYSRFNLFTGKAGIKHFKKREESFKANETAMVHCGFYSEHGGFRISDEDKRYMHTCRAVVSTCAFGGGDDLYQLIGMTEASLAKVCYVAFWDDITQSSQKAEGTKINHDHMIT